MRELAQFKQRAGIVRSLLAAGGAFSGGGAPLIELLMGLDEGLIGGGGGVDRGDGRVGIVCEACNGSGGCNVCNAVTLCEACGVCEMQE